MKRAIILLVILLLPVAFAQDIVVQTEEASGVIESFFADVDREDVLIVLGGKISVEDKILFNMIKSNAKELQGIEVDYDRHVAGDPGRLGKSLVLIGSPKTNIMSKEVAGLLSGVNESKYSPLRIVQASIDGKKLLMLYSEKEVLNNENHAVKKTPLAGIIPDRYVPIAATSVSLLLMYLWGILGRTAVNMANDFISSKVIGRFSRGRKIKKKKVHEIKPHEFINMNEVAAFLITVCVFALTMSWTWSGDLREFKGMFFLNLAVVASISFLRELVRLVFCYRQRLRSEYVLWPFGTVLTFLSTYLGNTFSMVSYTLLDEDEADEKKFGKSAFLIFAMTYIVGIGAYIINIVRPSLLLQMAFAYCIMVLFIEMFPLSPMAGAEVRKWDMRAWAVSYSLIVLSYIYMNFTAYV